MSCNSAPACLGQPAAPHLAAEGVYKSFGGSQALKGVSLCLNKGEVHALVGANGAGKSTLAKIIAGHHKADKGILQIAGQTVHIGNPREAMQHGVAMVTQQLSLAPDLSVAENIMLAELGRPGLFNKKSLYEQAEKLLSAVNQAGGIDLAASAGSLSSAHRQMVEIAKAMSQTPDVIIFDEPTTALTPFEVEALFAVMDGLVRQQKSLVFVSHRLEEIFTICNTVTVLRDGLNICASVPIQSLNQAELIRLMIGRDIGADMYGRLEKEEQTRQDALQCGGAPQQECILEVRNLRGKSMVHDVSFCLHRGEILGLAGLVGAGRTETARLLFGLDPMTGGQILLHGKNYTPSSPKHAYTHKMAMVPEDRKTQGVIADFLVDENIMISHSAAFSRWGTGYGRLLPTVLESIAKLQLAPHNLKKYILQLSGGMQQKAMISRALLVEPDILILDEPTQGVDIGTRSDIYAILRNLAAQGLSVVFISSDFEEVLGVCDRVVVLAEGRNTATVEARMVDEEKLTMFAAPRTSAKSTHAILSRLVEAYPCVSSYWVYLDKGLVYCFNRTDGTECLELGFGAGDVAPQICTCLALAQGHTPDWVEHDSGMSSLLFERHNQRGQKLGSIGLSVPTGARQQLDMDRLRQLILQ